MDHVFWIVSLFWFLWTGLITAEEGNRLLSVIIIKYVFNVLLIFCLSKTTSCLKVTHLNFHQECS